MTVEKKSETKSLAIRFSRGVLAFLRWATFGKVDLEYERRTTTIGSTMYTGTEWVTYGEYRRERELRHEAVHVEQYKKWGALYYVSYLTSIWHVIAVLATVLAGARWYVGAGALVLATAIPSCLSLRAYWEYRAFQVTLLKIKEQGLDRITPRAAYIDAYTRLLTRDPYFYAAWLITPIVRRLWARFLEDFQIGVQ